MGQVLTLKENLSALKEDIEANHLSRVSLGKSFHYSEHYFSHL